MGLEFSAANDSETSQAAHADQIPDAGQATYHELLQQAAGVGAIRVVRNLLKHKDIIQSATCARTPLHAACINGRTEIVQLLLEARASVGVADGNGVQPLHVAAQGGSEPVLSLLLGARAKMDAISMEKQTALHWAARSGAPGAVLNLLLAETGGVARKARGSKAPAAVKVDARSSETAVVDSRQEVRDLSVV